MQGTPPVFPVPLAAQANALQMLDAEGTNATGEKASPPGINSGDEAFTFFCKRTRGGASRPFL